jgi:hypothetical protein
MMQQHEAARADLTTALQLLQGDGLGGGKASGDAAAAAAAVSLAHMELNGSYWGQRISGLLAGLQC